LSPIVATWSPDLLKISVWSRITALAPPDHSTVQSAPLAAGYWMIP
jgi:hypothetical protein